MSFWQTFSAAPHRMMFYGGAVQLIATLLLWLVELIGRFTGLWQPLALTVPGTWAHGFLMLFGLFPFFIFGFLMTTYPRWMNGAVIPGRDYAGAFVAMLAGMVLFYLGLFSARVVAALGVLVYLVGWSLALRALFRVFRQAPATNKRYEKQLNVALAAGWSGIALFLLWLLSDAEILLHLSLQLGLWLFLIPVLILVGHRMIPYFSSVVLRDYRVVQPPWAFPVLWVGVSGHALLELLGWQAGLFLFDLPLLYLGVYHSAQWGLRRSLQNPLLGVLHLAFLWFAIGMALYVIQSLALATTGAYILGKGPLHALAIGFIAAMTLGMASRVTLGHSGRPLALDALSYGLFFGVQLSALLRVLADVPIINDVMPVHLNVLAALAWLLAFGVWVARFGPIYLRPRVDGQVG